MGKVPLPVLKELEHQDRQNLFTINFMAAFAKTLPSCNSTLEKYQHSLKSFFKRVKSQIQKGVNPEKGANVTKRPVSIWRFGIRLFLSTEISYLPKQITGPYIPEGALNRS